MEVEMKIRGLMMDPVTNMPIVVLKDINGNSILPIWVGIYEANAIALEIEKVSTPRPMTHDLIKTLLLGLGTGIRKVVVSELKDDTFYAVIWLDKDGDLISVDSRPSDALALALRLDCPIYVEEAVLKNSKMSNAATDKIEVTLVKGQNVLVLKVINEVNNWQACARFLKGGAPVKNLQIAAAPK